jgi:hypothetical protein
VKRRLFFQSGSFHDRVLAGPGVGVIAFLIGITTFINRDERRFRLQLAVYSAIIGVHFFLMGAGRNERRAQCATHGHFLTHP